MLHVKERLATVAIVACLIFSAGCAGNPVPILVANAAEGLSDSIGALNVAGKQLTDASIMSPAVNLGFQKTLLATNDNVAKLPPILRTIDRLQQVGDSTVADTDKAVALLEIIGQDISVVIAGVPLSDTTTALIALVRAAQHTVQVVHAQVNQIKGRE